MKYISEKAFAKINLYLEIFDKNDAGYHEIDTVMQTVSLCDNIKVGYERSEKTGISLVIENADFIPSDNRNSMYKAAELFLNEASLCGKIEIFCEKIIPIAAGLGGGSADAAAVLLALNKLTQVNMPVEKLCELGKKIGADVPFCIRRGAAVCRGTGEKFSDCSPLPDNTWILISVSPKGSNTARAYSLIDRVKNRKRDTGSDRMRDALKSGSLSEISKELYNGFEAVILPDNKGSSAIRRLMLISGAAGALMSGSGCSVFGLFDSEQKLGAAEKVLKIYGFGTFLCKTV